MLVLSHPGADYSLICYQYSRSLAFSQRAGDVLLRDKFRAVSKKVTVACR